MWNSIVNPEDTVYILGDVAFMNAADSVKVLTRLNGVKILVEGNHDSKLLEDQSFRECFAQVHKYLEITHNNQLICMCHYPIYDHNRAGRGSIMLHGHRHGNPTNIPGRIMDVGFDATGQIVSSLDQIVEDMQKIQHMYH